MSEDAQLKLRVTQELKEYIEEQAKNNHRTINGEVVYRLEQSKWINKELIEAKAHEFACILASALIQDPEVEIHGTVHGFRQPTIKGVEQAFELFLYRDPSNRKNLGVEKIEDGIRFFSDSAEYIIKNNNAFPDGAYTINHLSRILEKLYFLPMLRSSIND
ncbi:Arc family DNA-binding protein [Acinetobacter sp. ANC 4910]|uniref:Arc family DNA-binding protein n=1 Tax=Acinetobacter sp. ANC 4910 TaxID=2529850 RepID=UPI00103899E0|nr:Arc family DNA-binding protein [Acinetobacter sp. ANC 4910]TCB36857.1 Arc family DNA-binding protein [Acinetobacter sp. ANC 4910]